MDMPEYQSFHSKKKVSFKENGDARVLRDAIMVLDPPVSNASGPFSDNKEPGRDEDAAHIWMAPAIP